MYLGPGAKKIGLQKAASNCDNSILIVRTCSSILVNFVVSSFVSISSRTGVLFFSICQHFFFF